MAADDRLDEDNRAMLRALFAGWQEEGGAYVMNCLCLPDRVTQAATAVHHLSLFRNQPALRWSYSVHEQILPAFRQAGHAVRFSDVVIQHTGSLDREPRARKLQRELRLLERDLAERLGDPLTLFNLGQVYQEQGRTAPVQLLFRQSLQGSQPTDSIVRKLYALIVQCLNHLGQHREVLAICPEGRAACPDDVELMFQEGVVRRHQGDRAGAEACWQQVLTMPTGEYFASVHTGVRGYLTRHNLAALSREAGREAKAEAQWRAALAELLLQQERWAELEDQTRGLASAGPGGELRAVAIRARVHLARKEFAAGRHLLEEGGQRFPQAVELRRLLSYILLPEGRDWVAAEAALRAALALNPAGAETWHNFTVLRAQQGRPVELLPITAPTGLWEAARPAERGNRTPDGANCRKREVPCTGRIGARSGGGPRRGRSATQRWAGCSSL